MPDTRVLCAVGCFSLLALAQSSAQCAAPCVERVEIVATDAAMERDTLGAASDGWGGHQSRIVRMADGEVFVSWLVAGHARNRAEWRVARRDRGRWTQVGAGPTGREPPSLLRTPDDKLLLVAWPNGKPTVWTGVIRRDSVSWTAEAVPGAWVPLESYYGAAGVSSTGRLCILESADAHGMLPAAHVVACRDPGTAGAWTASRTDLPQRFAYAMVIPDDSVLYYIANRDVLWSQLGLQRPEKQGAYVYDSIRLWVDRLTDGRSAEFVIRSEVPRHRGEYVLAFARDFVQDGSRFHILYNALGPDTQNGNFEMRHALVEPGRVLWDESLPAPLPPDNGFQRLLMDVTGRSYWLFGINKTAILYPASTADGRRFASGVPLDVGGNRIAYSGFSVAAPRGGTPWSNVADLAFPSDGRVVYVRLRLADR